MLGCYRFTRKDIEFDIRTAMNLLMLHNKLSNELLTQFVYC